MTVIIVLDDAPVIVEAIAKILYSEFPAARVIKMTDPREIEAYKSSEIDLIISDQVMPGRLVVDVIRNFRGPGSLHHDIIVTGSLEDVPEILAPKDGLSPIQVFTKPLDIPRFVAYVRSVLVGKTSHTVLILDDEPEILALLGEVLRQRLPKVKVETRTSAFEALADFRSKDVDIVITDYLMPGISGEAFIREFRRGQLHHDVLITGASPDLTDLPDNSPLMVFNKPFLMDKLVAFIAASLGVEAK